jgi:carboxypeptidase Q
MIMKFKRIPALLCILFLLVLVPAYAEERLDLATIHRIKAEAFQNSHVMENEFYLTDVNGPRLTNSPGYFGAADWVVKQLTEWGIAAHQEKWPFGRGWAFTHFSAHLTTPQYAPLIGYPQAWTSGTNGVISGEPMLIEETLSTESDLEKYKGKLKGKIVMLGTRRELQMSMASLGRRYTDAELTELFLVPDPSALGGRPPVLIGGAPAGRGGQPGAQPAGGRGNREFQAKLQKFLSEEQPALILRSGQGRSEGGTVYGGSAGSRDLKDPVAPPTVVITPEHYNRICRLLDHKIPVKLEFEIQAKFFDDRTDSVNVIGEIPGGSKKDEVVMLGAHLDSWHGGTGATDNAAGSAVMIEAMRILKSLDLKMDRTVRMGLWGGEEEGLLGSKAYVKEHFGDPETMKLTSQHAKLSGYFNIDNGTGKIRGIYLQGNDMMRPVFESWFAPFKDLASPAIITIRNTGGTDHLSYDAVGLPGFQFVQDPMEYDSRTHHSNMDVYDRIQKGDMMQISAIVAAFVYNTAMREEMLPRKPLPKPTPARDGGRAGATGAAQDRN